MKYFGYIFPSLLLIKEDLRGLCNIFELGENMRLM